jgi:hypothetical protein
VSDPLNNQPYDVDLDCLTELDLSEVSLFLFFSKEQQQKRNANHTLFSKPAGACGDGEVK